MTPACGALRIRAGLVLFLVGGAVGGRMTRWDAGPRGSALVGVAALVWLALTLAFLAQARAGRPLLRA
ncbi:MAG: hypothetical protein KC645_02480 [Gemmatimonadetes bacterium]|nr:hypothetical protein [Gemmatimonadota bacterium]